MADQIVGDAYIGASAVADGSTPYFNNAVSTTVQTVKASTGRLYGLEVSHENLTDVFLQVFDVSGTVTLGTTAPNQSYLIPAAITSRRGAFDRIFVVPLQFNNAIKIAVTTTPTGSGAPGTGATVNAQYR